MGGNGLVNQELNPGLVGSQVGRELCEVIRQREPNLSLCEWRLPGSGCPVQLLWCYPGF